MTRKKRAAAVCVAILIILGIAILLMVQSCDAAEQAGGLPAEPLPEKDTTVPEAAATTAAPLPVQNPLSEPIVKDVDGPMQQDNDGDVQSATPTTGKTGENSTPAPATPKPTLTPIPTPAPTPIQTARPTSTPISITPPAQAATPEPTPVPTPMPTPAPQPTQPPVSRTICNICGADITGNIPAHGDGHLLNGEDFSYYVE